jgi:hypothetical protein
MLNPADKIYSMDLNNQTIYDVTRSSLLTTGLTAKSGKKIDSWTLNTKAFDAVTLIGLTNSPNVVGKVRYQLYDGFDTLTEVTGNVGQLIPLNAENIERIVITTSSDTNDGLPPKNLKLVLQGCFKEEQLLTKAQVEHRVTPSK